MSSTLLDLDISSYLSGTITKESKHELLRLWDESFCEHGAIILRGHGITNSLVNALNNESLSFFKDTPLNLKEQLTFGHYGNEKGGYSCVGMEAVAASILGKSAAKHVDPVESFVFRGQPCSFTLPTPTLTHTDTVDGGTADTDAGEQHIPSSSPSFPSPLFPSADIYVQKMQSLLKTIHVLCCEALEMERLEKKELEQEPEQVEEQEEEELDGFSYFESLYSDEGHADALRIAYYPPTSTLPTLSPAPRPRLRYGAHTDYQDITILKPDYNDWTILDSSSSYDSISGSNSSVGKSTVLTTGGLQILRRGAILREQDEEEGDAWIPIRITHDETIPTLDVPLIINIGDFWNIWTSNRWQSPVHRVTCECECKVEGVVANNITATTNTLLPPPKTTIMMTRARQSLVFFSLPRDSALVYPLKGGKLAASFSSDTCSGVFTDTNSDSNINGTGGANPNPSRYTPIRAGQHLANKIARSNR